MEEEERVESDEDMSSSFLSRPSAPTARKPSPVPGLSDDDNDDDDIPTRTVPKTFGSISDDEDSPFKAAPKKTYGSISDDDDDDESFKFGSENDSDAVPKPKSKPKPAAAKYVYFYFAFWCILVSFFFHTCHAYRYHWLLPFLSFFLSAFPSYISGVHHFWVRILHMWPFFNPTIMVVTFRLRGWWVLGVYLLPAFTRLGHERQDLLSPCDEMHVCTD